MNALSSSGSSPSRSASETHSPTSERSGGTQFSLTGPSQSESSVETVYRTASTSVRQRTAQACDKCRDRKTKCSGERPVCKRCSTRGLICHYTERDIRSVRGAVSGLRVQPDYSGPRNGLASSAPATPVSGTEYNQSDSASVPSLARQYSGMSSGPAPWPSVHEQRRSSSEQSSQASQGYDMQQGSPIFTNFSPNFTSDHPQNPPTQLMGVVLGQYQYTQQGVVLNQHLQMHAQIPSSADSYASSVDEQEYRARHYGQISPVARSMNDDAVVYAPHDPMAYHAGQNEHFSQGLDRHGDETRTITSSDTYGVSLHYSEFQDQPQLGQRAYTEFHPDTSTPPASIPDIEPQSSARQASGSLSDAPHSFIPPRLPSQHATDPLATMEDAGAPSIPPSHADLGRNQNRSA